MTYSLICGFECGAGATLFNGTNTERHFNSLTGAPAISTSVVRSGARSLEFAAAATAPTVTHTYGVAATQTYLYGRWYFRVTNATPSGTVTLSTINLDAAPHPTITLTTGGVIQFNLGSGAASGETIVADTWYGIEYEINVSANPRTAKWRMTNAAGAWSTRTAPTNQASVATTGNNVAHGCSGVTSGITVRFDDMAIGDGTTSEHWDDVTAKGGKVLRYLPTGDGTHSFTANDFRYNAAGSKILTSATDVNAYVGEDDQTSTAAFITQDVVNAAGYVEVTFADTGETSAPRAVAITSRHAGETNTAHTMSLKASDDAFTSTWAVWTDNDTSDSSGLHDRHRVSSTKPSGGAWTVAALNAMRVRWGYSSDVADRPYWHSVSLEAEFPDSVVYAAAEAATVAVWASAGIGSDLDLDAPHIPTTGAAAQPGPSVAVSAAVATATGAALDPSRVAPAEHIAATAQAHGVSASIKAAAAVATATGAAPQPLPGVAQMAGLASSAASATAHQPTIDVDSYAYAEHIAAIGTASDAAPSVGASAIVATATGEAIDGSGVGQGSSVATVSPPILITASVPVASIAVAFNAEVASSIGAASGAAPSVGASAGLASATGAAGAVLSPLAMTGGGPGPRSHAHVPGPRVIVTPHAPRPTVVVPRPR